jgi:hypothetical protein
MLHHDHLMASRKGAISVGERANIETARSIELPACVYAAPLGAKLNAAERHRRAICKSNRP